MMVLGFRPGHRGHRQASTHCRVPAARTLVWLWLWLMGTRAGPVSCDLQLCVLCWGRTGSGQRLQEEGAL